MPDYSSRAAIIPPVTLCAAMLLVGVLTATAAKLDIRGLFFPYLATASAITLLFTLGYMFLEVAILAKRTALHPLQSVLGKLGPRLPLLVLPALTLPLFLAGFTAAKSSIAFLVGYTWDSFWADADRLIFREDVWRLTHRILGSGSAWLWEWFYTVAWGGALFSISALVALYASKRTVGVFYAAMYATWLIGGCLIAYSFSAAGPVFAHIFEPSLDARFVPLRQVLSTTLGHGPIDQTQAYLASAVHSHVAVKGGGISAMPSMHLGAAAIYVLAARGTKWLIPAVIFWIVIFIASGYFGYHYWIDDIVGAAVAWLCWAGVSRLYDKARRREETRLG